MMGRKRLSDEEKAKNALLRKERDEQRQWVSKMESLPDSASPAAELDWIRNHPAMYRLARMGEAGKDAKVILDTEDITPAHGEAPSKAAVSMLQHWCNNPDEFFRGLLTEQKKATKVKDDGSIVDKVEETQEIKDIDALLASLENSASA
jgi:hypothetical protein